MKAYLDSSFLVSMYAPDAHSSMTALQMKKFRGTRLISSLGELELVNALEARVFRNQLTRQQVDKAHAVFEDDVKRGAYVIVELEPEAFIRAKRLVMQTTAAIGCRTADILHIAAALEAKVDRFFTFDERQKVVAHRARLKTN